MTIRMLMTFLAAALMALAPASAQDAQRIYLIHAGTLLATPGAQPLREQTVIVEGNKIVGVAAGYLDRAPGGQAAAVIDLSDKFVMPGLMDLHTHLSMNLAVPRTERMLYDRKPFAERAFRSADGARHLLLSGFTTVADLGGPAEVIFPLRDAIKEGLAVGPRIFASGPSLARTEGHGMVFCDGVDSCRRATRERIAAGADIVKIATGGSGSDATGAAGGPAEFFRDEIETIVRTAAQLNRKVLSHSVSKNSIDEAIKGGVWAVTHGVYADAESFRLMKERDVFLVTTTYVAHFLDRPSIQAGLSPEEWTQLSSTFDDVRSLPGRAYRAGVTLVVGTDAGFEKSADHAQELRLYVESGVPAAEALRSATVNAARLLQKEQSLGQLKEGFLADIIAVDGNPLNDITRLSKVSFVMKDGIVFKRAANLP